MTLQMRTQRSHGCALPVAIAEPSQTPRSVVLFLHGSGERGDDGVRQTIVGLGPAIARGEPWLRDAVVVMPQAPAEAVWLGEVADAALDALDAVTREHPDARVWVTGISLGGYGALHGAAARPGGFDAVVAVCGGVTQPGPQSIVRPSPYAAGADPFAALAARLGVPVWLAHGAEDPVIPAEQSRALHAALCAAGSPDPQLRDYAGAGHDVWDRAYADPALAAWLETHLRRA